MGGSSSPPPVADPTSVSQNQQQLDLQSAISQQAMNQLNQVDPFGNTLGYNQIGVGPGGVPIYGAAQTLSPQNQALLSTLQQGQFTGGQAGLNMLNSSFPLYSSLPDIGSAAGGATAANMQNFQDFEQPFWTQDRAQLDTQLRNQGIMPGTPAYQQQMNNLLQSQSQANSGFFAQTEPIAYSQALQNYQLPMQIGQSLLAMSSPQSPSFVQTPQSTVTPANEVGAVANAQQAQEQAFQAQQQAAAAQTLGISNIIGTALGGFLGGQFKPSDRRAKKNVKRVGVINITSDICLPVYQWKYMFDDEWHTGPMAGDVELIAPELVAEINGIKHIYVGA